MMSDAELLRRYAEEKSEAAFSELVQRHLPLVYSAALRRMGGDAHGAADVTQQVFTTLARRAAQVARHPVLTAWLYTSTRNAAIDLLRAQQRRRLYEQEAQTMNLATSDSGSNPEWEKLRPVLDHVIDELNETDRAAVLLRFFEKRSFAEIGAALRLREDAARMRTERALGKLQALLTRRGITSTSAAVGVLLANQAMAATVPTSLATSVTTTALAGAAAVGVAGSGVALLGFMSTSKIVVAVLAVVGIGGIGSAVYKNGQVREAEAAVAVLRRERDTLQARVAKLATDTREAAERARTSDERVTALQADLATARSSRAAARSSAETAVATTAATSPGSANPGMEMFTQPDYVRLSGEKYRANLRLQFAPLYKKLGLTPEQVAKFEANRAEHNQIGTEVWSAAVANGVPVSDPAVTNLMKEPMMNLEKELMVLLGDAGYKQYTQFNRAQAGLEVITTLAGNIYRSDSPLSAQQGEHLAEAVMNHTRSVPVAPGSKTVRYETDWAAVTKQAQTVLAPPQMTMFETILAAKKLQQEISALSANARATATTKPGGG